MSMLVIMPVVKTLLNKLRHNQVISERFGTQKCIQILIIAHKVSICIGSLDVDFFWKNTHMFNNFFHQELSTTKISLR